MTHSTCPLVLDLGCCGPAALQLVAWADGPHGLNGGGYGLEPEQADLLIVAGRVSPALCPLLDRLYGRLAQPRWVIAYGTCAISGALFDTVAVEKVIPVDVIVPGCPPHPDALRYVLARLPRQRAQ